MSSCSSPCHIGQYFYQVLALPLRAARLRRARPCAHTRVRTHTSHTRVRSCSASESACGRGCRYLLHTSFSVVPVDIERGREGVQWRVCERMFMAPRVRRGADEQYHRLASAACSQSERLPCVTKPAFPACLRCLPSLPACRPREETEPGPGPEREGAGPPGYADERR